MSKESSVNHPFLSVWENIVKAVKSKYFWFGFLLFVVLLFALRFSLIKQSNVHYHANFAIYINGQQEKFTSPLYFEEVQTCSGDFENDPKHRVHMHDQKIETVHVHDKAATWGHFMANLGFGLTKNLIETENGVFEDGVEDKKLTFYLNGQKTDSVTNKVIGSEDVLLVDYGNTGDDQLKQEYDGIVRSAAEANTKQDPSSCSGNKLTTKERLTKALKFWQ